MKLPCSLRFLVWVLTIFGFLVFIFPVIPVEGKWTQAISSAALLWTLAAMLVYVYHTACMAEATWAPSASFALIQSPTGPHGPYTVTFLIENHCRQSLKCWCNLKIKVNEKEVSLGGFYSKEHNWPLHPLAKEQGNFFIWRILDEASCSVSEMKRDLERGHPRDKFSIKVEFWYFPLDSNGNEGNRITNPPKKYYFDFSRDVLVLDV